jgi:hypothetical protein
MRLTFGPSLLENFTADAIDRPLNGISTKWPLALASNSFGCGERLTVKAKFSICVPTTQERRLVLSALSHSLKLAVRNLEVPARA